MAKPREEGISIIKRMMVEASKEQNKNKNMAKSKKTLEEMAGKLLVACDCVNQITYIGQATLDDYGSYLNDGEITISDYFPVPTRNIFGNEDNLTAYAASIIERYQDARGLTTPPSALPKPLGSLNLQKSHLVAVNVLKQLKYKENDEDDEFERDEDDEDEDADDKFTRMVEEIIKRKN